jgi:hypothetical protein
MQLNLGPHPVTPPSSTDLKLWATVDHSAAFGLTATMNIWFAVGAPLDAFIIPESPEPRRRDGLWSTTCFELFMRRPGEADYREWNFAPSGDWAAYDFTDYRQGMAAAPVDSPPYLRLEDSLTWWTFGATIGVDAGQPWEFGLSAVIEEQDGTKSYWALAHPSEKPDFHHPDCFVARLA